MSLCCQTWSRKGDLVPGMEHENSSCSFSPQCTASQKTILIASGTVIAVGGVFVLLAAFQVIPNGVNAISSMGNWGIVGASIISVGGGIVVAIGAFSKKSRESIAIPRLVTDRIANHYYSIDLKKDVVEGEGKDDYLKRCKEEVVPKALEILRDIGLNNPEVEFWFRSMETEEERLRMIGSVGGSDYYGIAVTVKSDELNTTFNLIPNVIEINHSCGRMEFNPPSDAHVMESFIKALTTPNFDGFEKPASPKFLFPTGLLSRDEI
jgi:hypothetical protein